MAFLLISYALSAQENRVTGVVADTLVYLEQVRNNPDAELVDLEDYVYGLQKDIRLATKNNPANKSLYCSEAVFVRRPVAVSLGFVQEALNRRGYGLIILDAYRPFGVAEELSEFEASDNLKHCRGASVDVSLASLETGEEIQMPGGYGLASESAGIDFNQLPRDVLQNRDILIRTMHQHGFRVSPEHWWHFDFMGWQAFPLTGFTFEELKSIKK